MSELIEDIVGQKAVEQVDSLTDKLIFLAKKIEEVNASGRKLEFDLKGAKNIEDTVNLMDKLQANTVDTTRVAAEWSKTMRETDSLLKNFGTNLEQNIRVQLNYKGELAAVKEQLKEMKKHTNDFTTASQNQKAIIVELTQKEKELGIAIKEQGQLINAQAKANAANTGSIDQMSAKLGQYRDIFRQLSAEDRNSQVGKQLLSTVQELDPAIKSFDASTGNFQRNVGNYKQAWNGLSNSITQVTRELPSFANSMSTGFMGISNNIGPLADEINKIRQENKKLAADGLPTVSVLKQLGSAIFSWQTALSVGITLMVVYGKQLIDWATGADKAAEAQKKMAEAAKENAAAQKKVADTIGQEVSELKTLAQAASNTSLSYQERSKAVDELQRKFPEYFANLSREDILNGNVAKSINLATEAIVKKARAQQVTEKYTKELQKLAALENELASLQNPGKNTFNYNTGDGLINDKKNEINIQKQKIQEIENSIRATRVVGAEESYWLDTNTKKQYEANQAKAKGNALLTEEERKLRDKADRQSDKAYLEQQKKDIAEQAKLAQENALKGAIMQYRISLLEPSEAEVQSTLDQIQEIMNNGTPVYIKVDVEIANAVQNTKDSLAAVDKELKSNLLKIEKAYAEGLMTYEEYEAAKLNANIKGSQKRFSVETQGAKDLLAVQTLSHEERLANEDKLNDLELESYQRMNTEKIKSEKELNAVIEKLKKEALDTALSFIDTLFKKKEQGVDSEIRANERSKDAEINKINATTLSQEEKVRRIAEVNATAAIKQEQLERKKVELQRRQANWEKAMNIAKVIMDTSTAVVEALPNIPASIAVGAIGALQIARIMATPLPQYADGTDNAPGGWAITDERGPEGYELPDGRKFIGSNDGPTLRYLPKHTKVIPHEEMIQMSTYSMMNGHPVLPHYDESKIDLSEVVNELKDSKAINKQILKQLSKQQPVTIVNNSGWAAYENNLRH